MDGYGISRAAYEEMRAFCLQYDEKRKKVLEISYLHGVSYDGAKGGRNPESQPTENIAEKLAKYDEDVEVIDSAAREAAPGYEKYIIYSVTKNVPYWRLRIERDIPVGEHTFNAMRRKFFFILAKKKGIA